MREPERGSGAEAEAETTEGESLVELVLSAHERRVESEPAPILGVVIGVLAGLSPAGEALVDFAANPAGAPIPARSAARLDPGAVGREAALMFEGGDPRKPILMGLLEQPAIVEEPAPAAEAQSETPPQPLRVEVDGERVVLEAEKEIVLRCGKASITLTRAGKILIRGEYVLTRAAGVNRIQGGSVQIN